MDLSLAGILGSLWTWFWVAVSFGVIIFIHEMGHFISGKLINVKIEKFSLGFGRKVFGFRRGETEYQVSWLPLGGYVKMDGEYPEKDADYRKLSKRAFIRKPWWQRVVVYFAGPFFNYLGAILITVLILVIGVKMEVYPVKVEVRADWPAAAAGVRDGDIIVSVEETAVGNMGELSRAIREKAGSEGRELKLSLQRGGEKVKVSVRPRYDEGTERFMIGVSGGPPPLPAVIGETIIGLPARQVGGIKKGDRVLSVDGKEVSSFEEVAGIVYKRPGQETEFLVERKGKRHRVLLVPEEIGGGGRVGIRPPAVENYRLERLWPWQAFRVAFVSVNMILTQICRGLASLFMGEQDVRKSIGGPITIFRMMGQEARSGWRDLVHLVVMLNVMLAVLNLLPIPVVDGGEILLAIAEGLRRRPLKVRTIMVFKQAGFAFIILLIVLATVNDIGRWFQEIFRTQIP